MWLKPLSEPPSGQMRNCTPPCSSPYPSVLFLQSVACRLPIKVHQWVMLITGRWTGTVKCNHRPLWKTNVLLSGSFLSCRRIKIQIRESFQNNLAAKSRGRLPWVFSRLPKSNGGSPPVCFIFSLQQFPRCNKLALACVGMTRAAWKGWKSIQPVPPNIFTQCWLFITQRLMTTCMRCNRDLLLQSWF